MNLPATSDRVVANTATEVNTRLANETRGRLSYYRDHRSEIPDRLRALDREWDIERVLETNASALAFTGVVLGATASRRFLWLPAIVTGFLFQHAVQGWCPPLPLFRRLGYRTQREIENERESLQDLLDRAPAG